MGSNKPSSSDGILQISPPDIANLGGSGDVEPDRKDADATFSFVKVFTENYLVMKKLLSFLALDEMKILMMVHRGLPDAVRRNEIFSKGVCLDISKHADILQSDLFATYPWETLALNLSSGEVGAVAGMEDVTVLKLYLANDDITAQPIDDLTLARKLEVLLGKTKKLRTLQLEARILNEVHPNVQAHEVLSRLDRLEIISYRSEPGKECRFQDLKHFPSNFLSNARMNLKSISFWNVWASDKLTEAHEFQFMARLIEMSKERLEELKANIFIWSLEDLTEVRCPNLKRLTISTFGFRDGKYVRIVEAFLENQPPLEELDISLIYHFPLTILDTLGLNGKLEKMKRLHLKTRFFITQHGEPDWRFVESMKELKDFRIRKSSWNRSGLSSTRNPLRDHVEEDIDNGYLLLRHLPRSVEKVSLQGFQFFWPMCPPVMLGKLLSRFQNLKELNLLRSLESLRDGGLQYIISNCAKLTLLRFSDCPDLTDFGITGNRNGKQCGRSLKELKGLQHLTIRRCKHVSLAAVMAAVHFNHLRSFDFYKEGKDEDGFLSKDIKRLFLHIAKNNPTLSRIPLHPNYNQPSQDLKGLQIVMKGINPRIKFELADKRWGETPDNVCSDDVLNEPNGPDDENLNWMGIGFNHVSRNEMGQNISRLMRSMGMNWDIQIGVSDDGPVDHDEGGDLSLTVQSIPRLM